MVQTDCWRRIFFFLFGPWSLGGGAIVLISHVMTSSWWDESIHLCEVNRSQLGCCVQDGKGKWGRLQPPPLNKRGDRMHPHLRGQTHHPVAIGEEQLPLSWVSSPLLDRRVNPHGAWSMKWDFPCVCGSGNSNNKSVLQFNLWAICPALPSQALWK